MYIYLYNIDVKYWCPAPTRGRAPGKTPRAAATSLRGTGTEKGEQGVRMPEQKGTKKDSDQDNKGMAPSVDIYICMDLYIYNRGLLYLYLDTDSHDYIYIYAWPDLLRRSTFSRVAWRWRAGARAAVLQHRI